MSVSDPFGFFGTEVSPVSSYALFDIVVRRFKPQLRLREKMWADVVFSEKLKPTTEAQLTTRTPRTRDLRKL
jgi:hypothetical protein